MQPRHRLITTAFMSSALLLAACGTGRVAYHKPGAMADERLRDQRHCTWVAADNPDHGELMMVYRIDRDVYQRCMAGRGYTTVAVPR